MTLIKMKLLIFAEIKPLETKGLETQSGANVVNVNLIIINLKVDFVQYCDVIVLKWFFFDTINEVMGLFRYFYFAHQYFSLPLFFFPTIDVR